ncbi:pentatricopeptide repeat-containing protein At4g14170 [Nymphaea colorata]|uniref:pentatricopeptide repeat-containing protein At4g14170 n=1 Tax=Nymphaea colorata TaxID=210225 RepID=UPI00129E25FD|nr:pentatricopeptide repeat-containing protein At4g14170 [Nymphaea colorata]XP_031477892.1 pentatricopeptide repeat-containing protein At4g14170 [Nymphaea colorata]XP_031477900.1 pentatricopeptide repeat-containing protein At4g14170 [Nymphaea colorata]XP_031477909.1 pentatricopeptide repeat-containing protein At4g14170 [Nymphaea colorata]XP_049932958.1 pentatricopeptide repeat-containing protein At4g14170 [Nymphaea colorata]
MQPCELRATISAFFRLLDCSPNARSLRHLHARLLRNGLYDNVVLSSKLVLMYSKHGRLLPDAYSVFLHMPNRNIYSWNIIIGELSRAGLARKSISVFTQMLESSQKPDVFTLPLVLRACAIDTNLSLGLQIHGFCSKAGFERNLYVASALVFLYAGLGRIVDARKLFDEMPVRDSVLWTTMVSGYAQSGLVEEAVEIYRAMAAENLELDEVVMVSLLLACSQLGCLRHGRSVHGWVVRRFSRWGLSLGNALLDMYVKNGNFRVAGYLFDEMPERDVVSWSTMVVGYGIHGRGEEAFELFQRMKVAKVNPNSVTFIGVLSACAHAGMVDEALQCFRMMERFGIVSELKHYACMVDTLGRAGLLKEAEKFISEMPMDADGAVWGALLASCRVHGNVDVGERAARKLLELEPCRAGYHVLLANMYAAAGRFEDAGRVRDCMKETNVVKNPGCSSIELGGSV